MRKGEPLDIQAPGVVARRLPHALLAYCALSWGLIESASFFVARYRWPDVFIDGLVTLLVAGLPACLILTWRHGLPGRQRFTPRELVWAGLASLVTLGVFLAVGPSRTLRHEVAVVDQPDSAKRVTFHFKNKPAQEVFELLAQANGLGLSLADGVPNRRVNFQVHGARLGAVLAMMGRQLGVECVVRDGILEVTPRAMGPAPPPLPGRPGH